jgi:phosphopantothenoylcysteine decarboxylase/phosphopantothenate--cysteine ligase
VSRADIGFDAANNEVVLFDRWGGVVAVPRQSKGEVADRILDRVQELRRAVREPQARLT